MEDGDEQLVKIIDSRKETRPEIDKGYGWVVVFSGFLCIFMIDGIGYTFGILLPHVMNDLMSSPSMTSLGGSIQLGTLYSISIVCGPLINRFGCRIVGIGGAVLSCIGLFVCSFVHSIWIFMVTFGFITGCGFGFLNLVSLITVNHYFNTKRGTAQGVLHSGSGFGQMCMSRVFKILLDIYGWRGSLVIMAGLCLQLCVACALFRPVKRKQTREIENVNQQHLLSNKRFLVLAVGVFFNQMAQQIPSTFFVVAATSTGLPETSVVWIYFAFGIMQMLGRLLPGIIVDRTRITSTYMCSVGMLGCTVVCFLFPVCTTVPWLIAFSGVYGFFIAFFSVLNAMMVFDCVGLADLTMGLSIILLIRGPAAMGGPPIAGKIFEYTQNHNNIMTFTGCLLLLSSIIYVSYPLYQYISTSETKSDNSVKETVLHVSS